MTAPDQVPNPTGTLTKRVDSDPEAEISGLRVRLVPVPGARTVAACLRVSAGSGADPARPWGTAHLTEHMRIAAALGGDPAGSRLHITGRTGNHETRFTIAALPEQSESVVRAFAGLLDPRRSVDEAVLRSERHAVALEDRAASAGPLVLLGPAAAQAAVPEGRLADSMRATPQSVGRITLADIEDFTAEHYRPQSALLSLAGPGSQRERLLSAVEEALPSNRHGSLLPAAPADASGDRPPLVLPAELDGLLVLTVPADGPEPLRGSIVRILTSSTGLVSARTARVGHPALGRTTVTDGNHEVGVVCWRVDDGDRAHVRALHAALAGSLADVLRGGREITEEWRTTLLLARQERAFAEGSPLGRAQAELLPPPLADLPPTLQDQTPDIPDELRRATTRARLWRVHAGTLHVQDLPESRGSSL